MGFAHKNFGRNFQFHQNSKTLKKAWDLKTSFFFLDSMALLEPILYIKLVSMAIYLK